MALATILVVDDTAEVLELTASALQDAGYEVVCCAGSREALAVLNNGQIVDLLVTDVAMPEIDGVELVRRARALKPSLPIAYITANPDSVLDRTQEMSGPILRKPYRVPELYSCIEELLAPAEDARLVRAVASEMIDRFADPYDRAAEEEEVARMRGDDLSARAWQDIADAITILQRSG